MKTIFYKSYLTLPTWGGHVAKVMDIIPTEKAAKEWAGRVDDNNRLYGTCESLCLKSSYTKEDLEDMEQRKSPVTVIPGEVVIYAGNGKQYRITTTAPDRYQYYTDLLGFELV